MNWCEGEGLKSTPQGVIVTLEKGRSHRIEVIQRVADILLRAKVARCESRRQEEEVVLQAWRRNLVMHLAGFRVDADGRLVGEYHIPRIGMTPEAFRFILHRFATECDRFEFVLSGEDRE